MEQFFTLNLEVEKNVDTERIRHWLDVALDAKVEFQYFLASHAGVLSGWDAIDGKLYVRNSTEISAQELTGYLDVPNSLVKALKVTKMPQACNQ